MPSNTHSRLEDTLCIPHKWLHAVVSFSPAPAQLQHYQSIPIHGELNPYPLPQDTIEPSPPGHWQSTIVILAML